MEKYLLTGSRNNTCSLCLVPTYGVLHGMLGYWAVSIECSVTSTRSNPGTIKKMWLSHPRRETRARLPSTEREHGAWPRLRTFLSGPSKSLRYLDSAVEDAAAPYNRRSRQLLVGTVPFLRLSCILRVGHQIRWNTLYQYIRSKSEVRSWTRGGVGVGANYETTRDPSTAAPRSSQRRPAPPRYGSSRICWLSSQESQRRDSSH